MTPDEQAAWARGAHSRARNALAFTTLKQNVEARGLHLGVDIDPRNGKEHPQRDLVLVAARSAPVRDGTIVARIVVDDPMPAACARMRMALDRAGA